MPKREAIERETFDWGVRLTVRPFTDVNVDIVIQADIGPYKRNRGSDIRITFPGASITSPLRLGDAQVWCEALQALVAETRVVVADMKSEFGSR